MILQTFHLSYYFQEEEGMDGFWNIEGDSRDKERMHFIGLQKEAYWFLLLV